MTVAIDPATGGIRVDPVDRRGDRPARPAARHRRAGRPRRQARRQPDALRPRSRPTTAGPALAQATTTGTIHDPRRRPPARRVSSSDSGSGAAGRRWRSEITLSDLDPAWLRPARRRPTPGPITWPADGPGPTRSRPSGGPPCSPRRPPRPSGPRRPTRSTSPRGSGGRPSSSAAWPTTDATGPGCSTRSWSPAPRRPGPSPWASRSTWSTPSPPRST